MIKVESLEEKLTDDLNKLLGDQTLYDKILKKYSSRLVSEYKTALKEIQNLLTEMFDEFEDDISYAEMQKYNRLKNLEKNILQELKKLGVNSKSIIRNAIKETFAESYYYSAYAYESILGIKAGFGLLNPKVIEASIFNELMPAKWTDLINKNIVNLYDQIRSEITQGLIQGKGYVKIARELKNKTLGKDYAKFKQAGGSLYEILRTVRTETHRVENAGKLLAYGKLESASDELNLKVKKIWISTKDNRTRPDHVKLDQQEADDEGLFHVSGFTAKAPGLFGVPEEDIHCRCSLGTKIIFIGSEPKTEKIKLTEWKKERLAA